mgnify:CR=1 FL=1
MLPEIIDIRTEYGIRGNVISSKGTEWTVICSNEKEFAKPTFSRVIQVRKFNKEFLLEENSSRKIQTIAVVMEQEKRYELIDEFIEKDGINKTEKLLNEIIDIEEVKI